jgi:hypothetical protein
VNVTILADNDHDGLPAGVDNLPCVGGGGDSNPLNSFSDTDQDGLIAIDDIFTDSNNNPYSTTNNAACTPQTNYAGNGIYLPTPISLSSTNAALSVAGISVRHRNLAQVPKSAVAITAIDGLAVPASAGLQAKQWLVSGSFGAASFSLQNLVAFLNNNHFKPGTIVMTITGKATAGQLGATSNWEFDVPVNVKLNP